jgi:hypothetical protein
VDGSNDDCITCLVHIWQLLNCCCDLHLNADVYACSC